MIAAMTNQHRAPWDCTFAKNDGNDCLPGEEPASDHQYFEVLCLCILQSGLNWGSIRKHWPRYSKGFLGFDVRKLSEASAEELLRSPDVIRHPSKVGALVHNAREFHAIADEYGSFRAYLATLEELSEHEQLKAVAKRFKHVGPETADYFLHAVGFRR